ncbi:oxidoreductase, short chain dehydrogenase/reductase family protein [Plesiocystis pacifica SIR-1]|uniref:Oxidoreductase, short chain dehydrogenase/reductase family protein n=1 Tax=Plesiocystis pacifica SIR-1 TaxID=391625 RepID=A6FYS3_9BACT|nr:NAD(P)-dependent oxidoreductase [Plesiocystis pacifica]EDM81345.1 oxidoreductase, short chain dehydrogenase/reductase family protein [Plesiocystis pacifica SIR-1]
MATLAGKTLFITGASRGIGKAIALRAARDGAKVVIAAKTAEPHPKLEGTIFTAAKEIEEAGGEALPVVVDVRSEDAVKAAVAKGVEAFGGLDILINNASAIMLTGTLATPMKRFDLMHQVNARGTYLCSQACLPHLLKAENPHILNISPPLNMNPRWFRDHVAYTMAKYGMSMCVLGMAEEFKRKGVGVNALWPRTSIATAAVKNLLGGDAMMQRSRTTDIMSDAAHIILTRAAKGCTGNFFLDDEVLAAEGITDLDRYAVDPSQKLIIDFFLDEADAANGADSPV